ncbi:MAG: polysaccharide deacetylase family protein, partial [Clostridiales bacterium]|nr:polysaccharide deacetylase family protein [Clostridiales bacterium]
MVVMFHRFITTYEKGDKQYTTTFGAFEQLLQRLYDMDYRLVNLNDMLAGNINVPAGKIPMVFTFDDGTPGQFSLVEGEASSGAAFKANPQSAVGVMEKFNESHPDFGLKGTFYVNLEGQPFNGSGTVADRLKYLVDEGFEIGNHTYSHINLKKATDALKIQEEIGKNIITMENLIPGYIMKTLSLPYGLPSKELQQYVAKGEYNGEAYENIGILEVGWDPSVSPVSSRFNPLKIHRVRATGIEKVESDLDWWLEELTREEQYISDGDP